jgi:hypothetical protein
MEKSLRRVRDSQRIRVYRANSGVLGTALPHMDDVRDFCEEVLASPLWNTLFPRDTPWKVPPLKPGRGARTAHVLWHHDGRIEIAFPRAYRFATYVLHELTHYGIGYRDDIAAHGPEFAGLWLTLVREFCSTRTSNALEKGLAREKVRVYIPVFGDLEMSDDHELDLTSYDEVDNSTEIDQLSLFER